MNSSTIQIYGCDEINGRFQQLEITTLEGDGKMCFEKPDQEDGYESGTKGSPERTVRGSTEEDPSKIESRK